MWKSFLLLLLSALLVLSLTACGKKDSAADSSTSQPENESSTAEAKTADHLIVRFGGNGASFTMDLEDNDTAKKIVEYVGTASWQLPIYHFDDYEGWEFFQYYDIPSRYEIPSNAETVTAEKAGEVYYSDPNRIVLFYQDAEISGEYTLVGHFDADEDFISAVEDNPVLEGWGNKIVIISAEE